MPDNFDRRRPNICPPCRCEHDRRDDHRERREDRRDERREDRRDERRERRDRY